MHTSNDWTELVQILINQNATDNNVRMSAEAAYKEFSDREPILCIQSLTAILLKCDVENSGTIKMKATVLLRKLMVNQHVEAMSVQQVLQLREAFVQVLRFEPVAKVLNMFGHCIKEFVRCKTLKEVPPWVELSALIFEVFHNDPDVAKKVSVLQVLTIVIGSLELISASMNQAWLDLLPMIERSLTSEHLALKTQGIMLVLELVTVRPKEDAKRMQAALPIIVQCLFAFKQLMFTDVNQAPIIIDDMSKILEKLIGLLDFSSGWFLKPEMSALSELMEAIIFEGKAYPLVWQCEKYKTDIRFMALHGLTALVTTLPSASKHKGGLIERAVNTCLQLMCEITDDQILTWDVPVWDENNEDDWQEMDYGESELIGMVGEKTLREDVMKIIFSQLDTYLNPTTATWQMHICGLQTLRYVGEYFEHTNLEVSVENILLTYVLPFTKSPNPRVRHGVALCLHQMCLDHPNVVHSNDEFEMAMMEGLLELAGDSRSNRVVSSSCDLLSQYLEKDYGMEQKAVAPWVPRIIEMMVSRLDQNNQSIIREAAITVIATLARTGETLMRPYYEQLMPSLKDFASLKHHLEEKEFEKLRGKIFECIACLGSTVELDQFRPDAQNLMNAVMETSLNLRDDDCQQRESINLACEQVSNVMGEEFAQYLPSILPMLYKTFAIKCEEFDKVQREYGYDDNEIGSSFALAMDDEEGEMEDSVLAEELMANLDLVSTLCKNTKTAFAPFIPKTCEELIKIQKRLMSQNIDRVVRTVYATLIDTLGQAIKEGKAPADDLPSVLWDFVNRSVHQASVLVSDNLIFQEIPNDEKVTQVSVDLFNPDTVKIVPEKVFDMMCPSDLITLMEGLDKCIDTAGPNVLTEEQVLSVTVVLYNLIFLSLRRTRSDNEARIQCEEDASSDDDGFQFEHDMLDEETESNLQVAITDVTGKLMKNYDQIFFSKGLNLFVPLVAELLENERSFDEKCLGVFIVCDWVEHMGALLKPEHWALFGEKVVNFLDQDNLQLRQASCYCIMFAARCDIFGPLLAPAATKMMHILTAVTPEIRRNKQNSSTVVAADASAFSLAAILEKGDPSLGEQFLTQGWGVLINYLPVVTPEGEAVRLHQQVLDGLIKRNKYITNGGDSTSIVKVLAKLIDVYKTDDMSEESCVILRNALVESMGIPEYQILFDSILTTQQFKKLKKILR
jgi:hypothetical protein